MGTSKKRPPGDSQRAHRRDTAQVAKVPYDGPAEVPVHLDAGRHKGANGVQIARMRAELAPVRQSGSSVSRMGGGGNAGRAARMNHGRIQQGGTMGRGNGHLNAGPCLRTTP
jgi:hypothetical protein